MLATTSPRHTKNSFRFDAGTGAPNGGGLSVGRTARKLATNIRSDSSPAEKLAFLQELKSEQKKMLNKSNVKNSLYDLINEHSVGNLNNSKAHL